MITNMRKKFLFGLFCICFCEILIVKMTCLVAM